MIWQIEQSNGLYLPEIGWHLDARKPVSKSFVSHAHFDHMGDHQTILCSPPTAKLIEQRIPGQRNWRIHEFGETFELEPGIKACLYPAGHIVGSSMLWVEREGRTFLYTGDFKLTPGISAERCQPVPAETLIIESTYGTPRYTFPPEKEVFEDIIRFCRETLDNDETPILYGYSLGKSQAILRSLSEASLEVMLHPASLKLTQSCQKLGWDYPAFLPFDPRNHRGKVIISPPQTKASNWLKSIHNPKTAMISGWAIDPSATYRYQCDKAFPLSDHADYLDLLSFVEKVKPKEVFTVHGFAREFADTLRSQGYQAWALGRENQLGLEIETSSPQAITNKPKPADPEAENTAQANSLSRLASTAASIAQTDSKSNKLEILASQLSALTPDDVSYCINLLDTPSVQLTKTIVKQSLILATGSSESEFKRLQSGSKDTSTTIRHLLERNKEHPSRSLQQVCAFLETLATAPNPIFQQSLLSEHLRKSPPADALFLYQHLSNLSTIGLTPKLICQGIAQRFQIACEETEAAYLRCSDLPKVSSAAATGTLDEIRIDYFQPISPIAPTTESSPEAIIEKQGLSLWSELEHDGLRCQLHKKGEHAELYNRDGEQITHLFPELVESARLVPQDFVADAVIVPWENERPLPQSELDNRLKRKAEELFLGEEIPVILWLIDLLGLADQDLLDTPLEKRRQKLDTFSVNTTVRITPVTQLLGVPQIEDAIEKAKQAGGRGIVLKAPRSPYNPLSSIPHWLRLPAGKQA
ncbi:MBL fold metallo-hydrolase [Pelagicoccus mobilis]|uniref:ATP-dependent DNA ligase family profile domain-containing protein n=1 Tax=Pelagicoccus mobilis TaxID=415221 RepID=A0A934S3R8_9BACT|nr:MBL fold metallo-hydrolase [Pelagicoccus mobilis]MBK1880156.1 hypothetical protein [Pelagicoccus mobilis]